MRVENCKEKSRRIFPMEKLISGIISVVNEMNLSEPVDYLVIGHLTIDQNTNGPSLGGTAAYAALTAQALGLRVGVVTSWGEEIQSGELAEITIVNIHSSESTVFVNKYQDKKRTQIVNSTAKQLEFEHIPPAWQSSKIVHLGPVAREVNPELITNFQSSLIGVTPQGWIRDWGEDGNVYVSDLPDASVFQNAGAVVLSPEDVDYNEDWIDEIVSLCPVVAVTEAEEGVRLYWNGDVRRFRPPEMQEIDPTGAGDIFASAFFSRLYTTRDPWEAARFANHLSAYSVIRQGLSAVPTSQEIKQSMVEVL
jgi:sugar/nucleoside kinase (ribokinase family)